MNTRKSVEGTVLGVVILAVCLSALRGEAAIITNVEVGDIFYRPANVSIHVGDKVRWFWTGQIQHSVTSNSGLWNNTGLKGNGFTFTNTFNTKGNFPYHCTLHASQTGTVIVQAAPSTPPTITIISPTNGQTMSAPASFFLEATAADTDGTVTNVEFFQGITSLGQVPASPYSIPVSGLSAGNYTFSAVATDNAGLKATNSVEVAVNLVAPTPVTLSSPTFIAGTGFQFSYSSEPGLTYVVQRSTDLAGWVPIHTNLAVTNFVLFQDAQAPSNQSFYRVGLLPNP